VLENGIVNSSTALQYRGGNGIITMKPTSEPEVVVGALDGAGLRRDHADPRCGANGAATFCEAHSGDGALHSRG